MYRQQCTSRLQVYICSLRPEKKLSPFSTLPPKIISLLREVSHGQTSLIARVHRHQRQSLLGNLLDKRHLASRSQGQKVSQVVARHDCHLPWRLKLYIHRWTFVSPMTQKILTKGLTWKWSPKPPALHLPPLETTYNFNLLSHITSLLATEAVIKVPQQLCFSAKFF